MEGTPSSDIPRRGDDGGWACAGPVCSTPKAMSGWFQVPLLRCQALSLPNVRELPPALRRRASATTGTATHTAKNKHGATTQRQITRYQGTMGALRVTSAIACLGMLHLMTPVEASSMPSTRATLLATAAQREPPERNVERTELTSSLRWRRIVASTLTEPGDRSNSTWSAEMPWLATEEMPSRIAAVHPRSKTGVTKRAEYSMLCKVIESVTPG
mmetsp:Transcript_126838/g.282723  ORF Transcript_126838/g.282723 Transcript_126838/m.282723 type:complete len:215 (+) Transcript_126838:756-1400(+)